MVLMIFEDVRMKRQMGVVVELYFLTSFFLMLTKLSSAGEYEELILVREGY